MAAKYFESYAKLFDKLTVKPNQLLLEIYFRQLAKQRKCSSFGGIRPAGMSLKISSTRNSALSVRMLEIVEPLTTISVFGRIRRYKLKGLILAQNERWRRG